MIALALMTYPRGEPERKARLPKQRFQKAVRPRTPQELAGLQRANDRRKANAAREAEQRREAAKSREF